MRVLLITSIVMFLSSCHHSEDKNVYEIIPEGSKLTRDIFVNSQQIVSNGNDLILMYNISKNTERYSPHLLFYNESLELQSATYFPSERVDSIINDTIYCVVNNDRITRMSWYKNDLPEGYILKINEWKGKVGYGTFSNKIIESYKLDCKNWSITFSIKKSDDQYAWDGRDYYKDDSLYYLNKYQLKDTLTFKLSHLHPKKSKDEILVCNINHAGDRKWDEMVVLKAGEVERIYEKMWGCIPSLGKNDQGDELYEFTPK